MTKQTMLLDTWKHKTLPQALSHYLRLKSQCPLSEWRNVHMREKPTVSEKIERLMSFLEIKTMECDWRSVAEIANDLRLLTCVKNISKYRTPEELTAEEKVCL